MKKIKKLMNQAIFEKFYISNDADMEFKVDAEFKPPFDQILEPVKDDIIRINRLAQDCSSKLSYCTSQQKLDTNFKYYLSINLISVQYGASFATFLSG